MKPIIFDTQTIQTILDGSRTQFRKPISLKDNSLNFNCLQGFDVVCAIFDNKNSNEKDYIFEAINSDYKTADTIWIKEPFGWDITYLPFEPDFSEIEKKDICYKVDYPNKGSDRHDYGLIQWQAPEDMPKKYARLFIEIVGIKVERLQEISVDDMIKSGFLLNRKRETCYLRQQKEFRNQWNKTAPKGCAWGDNPYVFVYEFKKIGES